VGRIDGGRGVELVPHLPAEVDGAADGLGVAEHARQVVEVPQREVRGNEAVLQAFEPWPRAPAFP
jgi:hypothetical protein